MRKVLAMVVGGGVLAFATIGSAKQNPTVVSIYKPDPPRPGQYDPTGGAGFAVVVQTTTVTMKAGENVVQLTGVPVSIDPTTVGLRDLTEPEADVLEQSFEYDLASVDKLLSKYVGQTITVVTDSGTTAGTLLTFDAAQLVLETKDSQTPIQIIQRGKSLRDIRFPELAGLRKEPALVWKIKAKKEGKHDLEVTYLTWGLAWSTDYTMVLSADQKKVDFSGWLSVANTSGAKFAGAKIKLIAGDVHRAASQQQQQQQPQYDEYGNYIDPNSQPSRPRYEYSVPTGATLEGTKQVELFKPISASGGKVYMYEYVPRYATYYQRQSYPQMDPGLDGYQGQPKPINEVAEFLEVKNTDKNGLGVSLPAGKVRIYRRGDDGGLALISEENMLHTGKDGEIRVRVGQTTDITGERKQVDFQVDERAKEIREKFEIRLKNKRKEAVEVVLMEMPFRWRNWRVDDESVPVVMTGDNRAQFRVKVPAGGDATLTFTMVYHTWP
jgi:hypothetical protein